MTFRLYSLDGKGDLTVETPYAGVFVKQQTQWYWLILKKKAKLFDALKFEHDYPLLAL